MDLKPKSEMRELLDHVLFVIVAYRLPIGRSPAWISLTLELAITKCQGCIAIFDNSPQPQELPDSAGLKTFYFHQADNPGIGASYNKASQLAIIEKKPWLFFLDQDTELPVNCLMKYYEAFNCNTQSLIFAPILKDSEGILSPFRWVRSRGSRITSALYGELSLENYYVINSGLMVWNEAFRNAGGYDERLVIDFCDIEFIRRFKSISEKIIIAGVELHHSFSGSTRQTLEDAMERFKRYCMDSKVMGQIAGERFSFWWQTVRRASRLSLRYRTTQFMWIQLNTYR
jgi:rhamnosyltransferase